jgi:zinc resistance-associated protein
LFSRRGGSFSGHQNKEFDMSTVVKSVLAGAMALALAGGSLVHAQQAQESERDQAPQRQQQRVEDIAAYGEARIAALKAGLKLTADQEKNWPALEQALKQAAKQRSEQYAAAHASADRQGDPIDRLRNYADDLTTRGATLKSVAEAAAPLYQSLDDAQKRRFVRLARFEARQYARDLHRGRHWHGGKDDDSRRRRGGRDGQR